MFGFLAWLSARRTEKRLDRLTLVPVERARPPVRLKDLLLLILYAWLLGAVVKLIVFGS